LETEKKQNDARGRMNGFADQVAVDFRPGFYQAQGNDHQDIEKKVYKYLIIHILWKHNAIAGSR
jgi:hypothetical protein